MKKILTFGLLILCLVGFANAQLLNNLSYDEVLKLATEENDPNAQNE